MGSPKGGARNSGDAHKDSQRIWDNCFYNLTGLKEKYKCFSNVAETEMKDFLKSNKVLKSVLFNILSKMVGESHCNPYEDVSTPPFFVQNQRRQFYNTYVHTQKNSE